MTRTTKARKAAGKGRSRQREPSNPLEWFHDGRSFDALSDQQKRQVSQYLEREDAAREFRPLTPAQRRRWERIKRKPGRPKLGKGTRVVSVTVEKDLLSRADAYAKRAGLTRARFVGIALESFLTAPRRNSAIAERRDY
jgi:hypothetical protein